MKFGGTSVEDAAAFGRVAEIVRDAAASARVVVVTSAMSRGTDTLLTAARDAAEGSVHQAEAGVAALLARYRAVASGLPADASRTDVEGAVSRAEAALAELLRVVRDHPGTRLPLRDEIVSWGERLASALLAAVLSAAGVGARAVDARRCVRTTADYGRAEPLGPETRDCTRAELLPLLEEGVVLVLGGFIGSTPEGATTTLGRGGSDYSAALVGAALGAAEIQIWTDVSGFLTADPRVVADARTLARLSYAEAAELAYFGAKVLHPRTIQPAVEHRIPVRVCNSRAPAAPTTLIGGAGEPSPHGIRAIAHKRGTTVVQVASAGMLGAYGFLRALFEVFERHRTAVDIVATSEVSVSLTVDDPTALPAIEGDLAALGRVTVEAGHAIVCAVGEGLRRRPGVAARVFGTIADVNVSLISQGASSINLTFVVPDDHVDDVVRRLHAALFPTGETGAG
jgi:aspartate kinase